MSTDSKTHVIPQPPQAAIPVTGTGKYFPIRRLWCVGRNYVEHIKEMGQDVREPPFFFAKPADAIVADGGTVPYPSLTKDMHHEVELVVALKSGGRNIKTEKALDCIYGSALASISPAAICKSRRATSSGRGRSARHSIIRLPVDRCARPTKSAIRRKAASRSRSMAKCARTAISIR